MRRIIASFLLMGILFSWGHGARAYVFLSAYDRIMMAVGARDEALLKKLISQGININVQNPSGQTPLCTVLYAKDSKGYQMLVNQGATVHTPCIRQIPRDTLASFYQENPQFGRYVDGRILVPITEAGDRSVLLGAIPWPHVGEILLAGLLVGVVATVGSGGKKTVPGGNSYDPDLFTPVDTGLTVDDFPALGLYWNDTSTYDTSSENISDAWEEATVRAQEYNGGGNWKSYVTKGGVTENILINTTAFLPMVNAGAAYARGYTGKVVDRSDVKKPTLTYEKVKVAIMDSGLETGGYAHNQLAPNISNIRLNFVYGICSETNKKKCWAFNKDDGYAYLTSGVSPVLEEVPASTAKRVMYTQQDIDDSTKSGVLDMKELMARARANWNVYSAAFAPKCSATYTENCLTADAQHSISGEIMYYVVTYHPLEGAEGGSDLTYRVDTRLWQEYEDKYGPDGYSYNETDTTPALLFQGETEGMWVSAEHGTTVAGVLASIQDGVAMSGVAPDAEIIPIRVDFPMQQVLEPLAQAVKTNAKVINLSFGANVALGAEAYSYSTPTEPIENNNDIWNSNLFFSDEIRAGYQAAAEKGTVLVFSAGNEAKMQPSIDVVAPLVGESEDIKTNYANSIYKHLLISVVAVDENNKMAYFGTENGVKYESNRCGASSMYCLAAPGGTGTLPIMSTSLGQKYSAVAGTSMAAPIVSGAVALLTGAFPFLKPQEVVQILFETANYIEPVRNKAKPDEDEVVAYNRASWLEAGHKTIDDMPADFDPYSENTVEGEYNAIYGHGLLDLDKATDPVGLTQISLDEVASSENETPASISTVTIPSALSQTLSALPQSIIVLDKYTRPYDVSMGHFVNVEKRSDALKRSFQSFMASDEKVVQANDALSFGFTSAPSDSVGIPAGSLTMRLKPSADMQIRMGYTQDTQSFGGNYTERIIQNPFMNMRQAWGTDVVWRLAGHWSLTGGFQYGQNGFIDSEKLDKMEQKPMMRVVQTGLNYAPKKSVVFNASFGQMREDESLFGLRGTGAFETDGNQTKFISFGTTIMPFDKWQLSASYTYGVTDADSTKTLMKFSRLTSDAFGLTALYHPDEESTYGFKVSSPLRVRSGTVTFDLPTARDMYDDRIYRTQYTADMKPDAREYDLSLFFMNQLKKELFIGGQAGVRLHPEHQKEARPDWNTLFKMNWMW